MIPGHHWARNFTVTDDDIEYLTNYLLERETPLSSAELARALVERRLALDAAAFQEQFRNARVYNPAQSYAVGDRVVFPVFDYALGTVEAVRRGDNPEYGEFSVIAVAFDNSANGGTREFAAELQVPHKLSQTTDSEIIINPNELSVDEVMAAEGDTIIGLVDERLSETPELVILANKWFPRALMLEVNEGHLMLAEAVLDLAGGGPMDAGAILQQIGGLGDAPQALQEFSLNYALSRDERFDEVGPAGQVWWYLTRLEPEEVRQTPAMLRYDEIEYDRELLTPEMLALEAEIDDELSPLKAPQNVGPEITVTLIYPHRRVGTLPLNAKMRHIFPTAHRTQRIWVRLVDGQDGEEYQGWVVRRARYVYGLAPFYRKHKLPVGAYVTVRPGDAPDQIVVNFHAYRPRTEWIRLIDVKNGQLTFENHKRSIGAEYDDLMIVGADDLAAVDALFASTQQSRRTLNAMLRQLISELSRLTPQGTVHAKTLYSAVNILRRCPPGPIFATLANDPDFEHVGNHYWKLASNS
ncbi:MAG: hypothetical protein DIU68_011050 [Chloroflexota bacterium]